MHEEFRSQLSQQCLHYPLVVVGYSGRDDSVMTALEAAYAQRGEGALYWLGMRGSSPHPRVQALIEQATAQGRRAEYIECDGFDALMHQLARYLLRDEPWGHCKARCINIQSVIRQADYFQFTLRAEPLFGQFFRLNGAIGGEQKAFPGFRYTFINFRMAGQVVTQTARDDFILREDSDFGSNQAFDSRFKQRVVRATQYKTVDVLLQQRR